MNKKVMNHNSTPDPERFACVFFHILKENMISILNFQKKEEEVDVLKSFYGFSITIVLKSEKGTKVGELQM